jgi:response regulator RpfG family c-di-GMP phosphodiesterase
MPMAKAIVYYIDDESRNLAVFEATLPSEWDIRVFDNPLKAIEAIKAGPEPSVIVSDQRMPGMSGVELLEKVRAIFPDAVRMIITGYSEFTAVRFGA